MQRAIGDKIGTTVMAFAMSLSGLFFAFFKGWYFSTLLLAFFPIMLGASVGIGAALSMGISENMRGYA